MTYMVLKSVLFCILKCLSHVDFFFNECCGQLQPGVMCWCGVVCSAFSFFLNQCTQQNANIRATFLHCMCLFLQLEVNRWEEHCLWPHCDAFSKCKYVLGVYNCNEHDCFYQVQLESAAQLCHPCSWPRFLLWAADTNSTGQLKISFYCHCCKGVQWCKWGKNSLNGYKRDQILNPTTNHMTVVQLAKVPSTGKSTYIHTRTSDFSF